ncbi:Sodium:neurotransmitter symporter family protein [Brugia malayi]|uniref:Transporter n=1 Tax=Brugia malayi TaxID=6279 RepID=A0A4E9EPP2_BRUMA|nr:Sodium:neurotransmitter symporter family protein [Brugia malayi]VIO85870.1 Sodium:neurotransmitter symporter family protein [Brugia malayi]
MSHRENDLSCIPTNIEESRIISNTSIESKFSSKVTFSAGSVAFEHKSNETDGLTEEKEYHQVVINDNSSSSGADDREGWDNKMQFLMGVISYAVGLGNVWRFPYLCQKNGGGAFLIPYCIMMFVEGTPLFLVELGIGQKLRLGPVGVWNEIHPYFGGVGVSAAIVSFLVALYYNVIITWCIYYLYRSFDINLPWSSCPEINGSVVEECRISSSTTSYFWNREAINTSESIGDFGGFVPHMTVSLILAWVLIYLCVMRGIKSSGKVMYLTATFPYAVTTIFLIRSLMLDGAAEGLKYMMNPDLKRLWDPNVWMEAATQIFYSMGLGFGGLIAFGSYNPEKNNCKKDVLWLSLCNLITSLYMAIVIFCVLGYMGVQNYNNCIKRDMANILAIYPNKFRNFDEIQKNISVEQYAIWMYRDFHDTEYSLLANVTGHCNYKQIISQAAEGTGLAFVVFTEAINQFPFPPFWAVMFFLMLLMLGMGSMFGTLEGVITSLNDSKLISLKKPVLTAILCSIACGIGLVFTTHSGQYWVMLFDHFAGTYSLMAVAFFEVLAVIYVYGWQNFARDLVDMTGETISCYWTITWRFISPVLMLILFFASIIKSFIDLPRYSVYNSVTTHQNAQTYPEWVLIIASSMVLFAMAPVPLIWFIRKFKIMNLEMDIPTSQKCLNATPSTTYILRSVSTVAQVSTESNAKLLPLKASF